MISFTPRNAANLSTRAQAIAHFVARRSFPLITLLIVFFVTLFPLQAADKLEGRAVLNASTFAPGPTSGQQLGTAPINGVPVPFVNKQPVQGFSAVRDNHDGTFLVMCDNGYGSLENSSDFNLRVYTIRPDFKKKGGGSGTIQVESFFELRDPDKKVPWAITNHFTAQRVLTGADFDIESMQRGKDGTFWFGDEFGPFILHTDKTGKLLEPPFALPDFQTGGQIRSPQSPLNEEASAVRIMNAVRQHARLHGNNRTPVFSPWDVMLDDGNANTFIDNRANPPEGSGLKPASSEIFNVASLKSAGYPVVTWTVNAKARMLELMKLGVNGIISDRPDLLRQAAAEFDGNNDGIPDFLLPDGLIDITKFDAQGHRGGRDLRPENTLPAVEVALDNLMTTIEGDSGVTSDHLTAISHDPIVNPDKCRRADGSSYTVGIPIKDLTLAQIQSTFICDKVFRGPDQQNDPSLSPVTVAYAAARGLPHIYLMPSVDQLFDFVAFYVDYYKSGAGAGNPDAERRWKNAEKVRYNLETKINPRQEFKDLTFDPQAFVTTLAGTIAAHHLESRADVQSFDFRTLLLVQEQFPAIRTVYLFGDFPIFDDPTIAGSDDGTNLQDEHGANTPWLAGLYWPYRVTRQSFPFRAQRSGGFEGMALTPDGKRLLPLLEQPLTGDLPGSLLINEFDIASRKYTGNRWWYLLGPGATNIGDFILFNKTKGLIIERDGSQGDPNGVKRITEITLGAPETAVQKRVDVDLMNIKDPNGISNGGDPGDVGLGPIFQFPFTTIEDVVVFDKQHIGVLNDNNFPFSIGRHVGTQQPDDEEFIIIKLDEVLGAKSKKK